MAEQWKAVVGWEGKYEVSDRGRVRSLDRILSDGRRWKGRLLKLQVGDNGYLHVTLGDNTTARIHTMVMYAFCGPPNRKLDIRHFDGDKTNCKLSNLSYGTRADNEADKVRHHRSNRKEDRIKCLRSRITEPI